MHKAKERERYPRAGDDEREYAQVRKADDTLRRGPVAHILKTEEHGIREVSEGAQDDDRSDRQGHCQATPCKGAARPRRRGGGPNRRGATPDRASTARESRD